MSTETTSLSRVPAAEWDTSAAVARALVQAQAPQWSHLPLAPLACGWDNALYRLGDALLVRLPRRTLALDCLRHEQRWLPRLAPSLPLPVPAPVHCGQGTETFPHPWSVVPFHPGEDALTGALEPGLAARQLADFYRALHQPAPEDAPFSPFRSVPLAERAEVVLPALASFDDGLLRAQLHAACQAEARSRPRTWLHGDTHPGNLVVRQRQVVAVIDFGDVCHGDPASDLCCAWMLFDKAARKCFFDQYGADAELRLRARGWAVQRLGAMMAVTDNPPAFTAMVHRAVARLREDG